MKDASLANKRIWGKLNIESTQSTLMRYPTVCSVTLSYNIPMLEQHNMFWKIYYNDIVLKMAETSNGKSNGAHVPLRMFRELIFKQKRKKIKH